MVDLATKTLLHDKLRFVITVSGVAFAVTLIMVQVGLFLGLLDNASVTIDHLDADLWITSKGTPNVDFAHAFPESRVDRVRSLPGVARADNLIVAFMYMQLPTGAEESVMTYALEDFRRWGLPWDVMEGDVDDLKRGNYMFLDESAEKRFGAFAVGDYREVLGQRLKLIGRTRGAKSFTTTPLGFVDFDLAQRLSPNLLTGNTTYVVVKLDPNADVEQVRALIRERLPYNDVFTKAEWAERSRGYWVKSTGIGFTMFLTVFLGCLVGVVVVAQTLYTQTMEHIKEFGTVKAIGGSNGLIYRILGKQATIAAVVGFVFGALPSLAVRSFAARAGMQVILTPTFGALVFAGTVVMCLLAAMISFRKVASIDPGLVFRT
jgi:putative ABC transport system permease protein